MYSIFCGAYGWKPIISGSFAEDRVFLPILLLPVWSAIPGTGDSSRRKYVAIERNRQRCFPYCVRLAIIGDTIAIIVYRTIYGSENTEHMAGDVFVSGCQWSCIHCNCLCVYITNRRITLLYVKIMAPGYILLRVVINNYFKKVIINLILPSE